MGRRGASWRENGTYKKSILLYPLFILLLLSACSPVSETAPPLAVEITATVPDAPLVPQQVRSPTARYIPPTPLPTPSAVTQQVSPTLTPSPTAGITPVGPTPPPAREWSAWPVLPYVSSRAIEIYRAGLERGNRPEVFSVIGDCQSIPDVFLGIYATGRYSLPEGYAYLEETIAYFEGSFAAERLAVRDGLRASSALSPLWADPERCLLNETPVECDLRVNRPAVVFVNLGTNLAPEELGGLYEPALRAVIETLLAHDVLPVLSTKADNIEGDYRINAITAVLAEEYQIPLWNFWRAADSLPGHGLKEDGIYLTIEAWDLRSFSGLLVLDHIQRALNPFQP